MAPNWVGDLVMATPTFRAIRKRFADAHITVMVRKYGIAVLEDAPWFDCVEPIEPSQEKLRGLRRFRRRIREGGCDLAVLMVNSFRSALLTRWAGVPRIVGYRRECRGPLLTDRLEPKRDGKRFVAWPMLDYYLELAAHLDCDVSNRRMQLFYREELAERLDDYSRRHGIDWTKRVIVMNPGAAFGSSKCWPVEHFARTAEQLSAEGNTQVLVACAPGERNIAARIAREAECDVLALTEEPVRLDMLKPMIDRAALLVTNDTGPRHYAVAFDRPVVTIIGPTDPRWSETGHDKEIVLQADVDCAPCMQRVCRIDHRCMRWVKPEMVVDAVHRLLE